MRDLRTQNLNIKLDQLEDQGYWQEAIKILRNECRIDTRNDDYFHRLGRLHQRLNQIKEAEKSYLIALTINPLRSNTYNNIGLLKLAERQTHQALHYLEKGLKIPKTKPQHTANIYSSLCQTYLFLRKPLIAAKNAQKLIQLNPHSNGYTNLAVCLRQQNKLLAAQRSQELSIAKGSGWHTTNRDKLIDSIGQPLDSVEASVNHHLEIVNLALYDLQLNPDDQRAQKLLFANIGMHTHCWTDRNFIQRTWRGEHVRNLTIWHDQGFGDTFQYLRWLQPASHLCNIIDLYLHPSLIRLVNERLAIPDNCKVHPLPSKNDPVWLKGDRHLGLCNLPGVLSELQLLNLSCHGGYLKRDCLIRPQQGIGLVWSAGKHHGIQPEWSARVRDVPLQKLVDHAMKWSKKYSEPLVSLQLGAENDLTIWRQKTQIYQANIRQDDWLSTANAIEQLKLVVTIDTAVGHLCGALGLPCIILLNCPCDWRWRQVGSDCRIFPTIKLARCSQPGHWESALLAAEPMLKKVLEKSSS